MTDTYRRAPDVEETSVGGRSILYHRSTGKAIVLNPTASLVWSLLATPQTSRSIADRVAERFPAVAPETLDDDVAAFLDATVGHGIVLANH